MPFSSRLVTVGGAHNSDYGSVISPHLAWITKIILTGFPGPRPRNPVVSYVLGALGRSVLRMSPRTGPRRPTVTFRIADAGIRRLEERAAAEGVQRSELLRIMLAYADRNMPKGWRP